VIFHSVAADVVGGPLPFAALVAVTWAAIRLAGDVDTPDDKPLT
jgi:hypothetical protein